MLTQLKTGVRFAMEYFVVLIDVSGDPANPLGLGAMASIGYLVMTTRQMLPPCGESSTEVNRAQDIVEPDDAKTAYV